MTKPRARLSERASLSTHRHGLFPQDQLGNLITVTFNLDWKKRTFFTLPPKSQYPHSPTHCAWPSPVPAQPVPEVTLSTLINVQCMAENGRGKFGVPEEMISWGMTSWSGGWWGGRPWHWLESVQMAGRNGAVLIACLQISHIFILRSNTKCVPLLHRGGSL